MTRRSLAYTSEPWVPKKRATGTWVGIGVAIGAGVGAAVGLEYLAIAIALGAALGAAVEWISQHKRS